MATYDHHHTAASTLPARNGHRIFVRTALATAMAVVLTGAYLVTTTDAAATLPETQPTASTSFAGPPSFAEVAAKVTPAVVNVAVTHEDQAASGHHGAKIPQLPHDSPMQEFFQRFFDGHSGVPKEFHMPGPAEGQGSGFIVDADGHVVTNNHVISNAAHVEVVLNDGRRYPARVKGRDAKTDLALLKIDAEAPLPFVVLGDSASTRVGDWVLAVGNPFGLGGSVSAGIVSARGRDINSGPYDDYLQIDAPINRGNSGGPLFDASGRVVGVNTAIYSPSGGNVGIGFAIPSSSARTVIAQLMEQGHVDRGWLGVQIQAVTEEIATTLGLATQQGALVASLVPNSPAAGSGLRPGDLILSVGDTAVDELKTLPRLIADTPAGTELVLVVLRNGSKERVSVVIGPMPVQDKVAGATKQSLDDGRPRLGLYLTPLTPEARKAHGIDGEASGVLVAEVEAGSPAQKAGVRPGSLISMVGQQQVIAPEDVVANVRTAVEEERESVLLLLEQDGEKRFVAVPFQA